MSKCCIILLSLVLISLAKVVPHPPADRPRVPNQFIIDLDKNHQDRWRQLIETKKQDFYKLLDFLNSNAPYKYLLPIANTLLDPIIHYFGKSDFLLECSALAKLANVPVATVALLQYMYELGTHNTKMCTGVLVSKDDYVFHIRNLDYDFAELLAGMTVQLHFKKNGKTLFKAVTQAGFLGVHTGIAYGRFAINLNERDKGSLLGSLWNFLNGKWRVTEIIRYVLENSESYNDAVDFLKKQGLISPAYFILSGLQSEQGIVITRNRNSVHDSITLKDAKNNGRSWIVQTNYDRDVPDPVQDFRRIPAESKMDGLNSYTEQRVMDEIMSTYPNFNIETLLTSTMSAKHNYTNTTIWY